MNAHNPSHPLAAASPNNPELVARVFIYVPPDAKSLEQSRFMYYNGHDVVGELYLDGREATVRARDVLPACNLAEVLRNFCYPVGVLSPTEDSSDHYNASGVIYQVLAQRLVKSPQDPEAHRAEQEDKLPWGIKRIWSLKGPLLQARLKAISESPTSARVVKQWNAMSTRLDDKQTLMTFHPVARMGLDTTGWWHWAFVVDTQKIERLLPGQHPPIMSTTQFEEVCALGLSYYSILRKYIATRVPVNDIERCLLIIFRQAYFDQTSARKDPTLELLWTGPQQAELLEAKLTSRSPDALADAPSLEQASDNASDQKLQIEASDPTSPQTLFTTSAQTSLPTDNLAQSAAMASRDIVAGSEPADTGALANLSIESGQSVKLEDSPDNDSVNIEKEAKKQKECQGKKSKKKKKKKGSKKEDLEESAKSTSSTENQGPGQRRGIGGIEQDELKAVEAPTAQAILPRAESISPLAETAMPSPPSPPPASSASSPPLPPLQREPSVLSPIQEEATTMFSTAQSTPSVASPLIPAPIVLFKFDSFSPQLRCRLPSCRQMTHPWDGDSVYCPACGPKSYVRYCRKAHLYEDIKRHHASECCTLKIEGPVDEQTIADHQNPPRTYLGYRFNPDLSNNIGSVERHRQAVYLAMEPEGDYFLFDDMMLLPDDQPVTPNTLATVRGKGQCIHTITIPDRGDASFAEFKWDHANIMDRGITSLDLQDMVYRVVARIRSWLIENRSWDEKTVTLLVQQIGWEFGWRVPAELQKL